MTFPDRDARDTARLRLDANIVVEAGAGTGKTTLLIDRLLFLIMAGGPSVPSEHPIIRPPVDPDRLSRRLRLG